MNTSVRAAQMKDAAELSKLIQALAEHEGIPDAAKALTPKVNLT